MEWLVPAVASALAGSLILTVVYVHLYLEYRERHVQIWLVSWSVYCVRLALQLAMLLSHETPLLMAGNQIASLVSGIFLLWGSLLFAGKNFSRAWWYAGTAGALWIAAASALPLSFPLLTVPTFFFLGAVYIWTGVAFIRFTDLAGPWKQVTGWLFILWGVHKLNFPFLRPVEWFAPWGFLLAALFGFSIALSILLVYFQKTRKDLIESEKRYRDLFDKGHSVMLLIDPETAEIVDANPAACAFYGYTPEGMKARKITDINTLTPEQVFREMERARVEERNYFLFRHRRANGEVRDVEVYSGPAAHRGETLLFSIVHDITDRRRTEEVLHTTMSQFAALIDNMNDGILFEDREQKIVLANSAFCDMFNIPARPQDLIGKDCHETAKLSRAILMDTVGFFKHKEEIMREGRTVGGELISLADGRILERTYVPIFVKGSALGHLWQYHDITAARKLQDQLRHAQKMEAVGTLAGGIAHDFNNILTAIIGYGNLLRNGLVRDTPLRGYADQVLASSERAAGLTHSLLAFSRKQHVNLRPVVVNEILGRVDKLLHRLIGEDIELTANIPDQPVTVLGDSGQIEQILMNLATNARDAMPGGGALTLELGVAELDASFRQVHGYGRPGSYALITVSDTGEGMDQGTAQRIFEPFFTTKEVGKGSGLGLSIVYGIVKQCNGYVNCYSEPGQGTTFKVYVPLTADTPARPLRESESPPTRGTETVLVAEDNKEVRDLVRAVLEQFGYTVLDAADGEEAARMFELHQNVISMMLLDVVMPKRNGKEVYELAKKIKPGIRALFTSGYTADIMHRKGILEEGLHFVSKPVSPRELLKKVREALDDTRGSGP
jgi:two-component system, cell cycle sensor histidine kinase and response regulator CckA